MFSPGGRKPTAEELLDFSALNSLELFLGLKDWEEPKWGGRRTRDYLAPKCTVLVVWAAHSPWRKLLSLPTSLSSSHTGPIHRRATSKASEAIEQSSTWSTNALISCITKDEENTPPSKRAKCWIPLQAALLHFDKLLSQLSAASNYTSPLITTTDSWALKTFIFKEIISHGLNTGGWKERKFKRKKKKKRRS